MFDWLKPRAPQNANDAFMGRYGLPKFERLDPALAEQIEAGVKNQLSAGPGHGAGGVCPIEADWNAALQELLPRVATQMASDVAALSGTIRVDCVASFQIECSYVAPRLGETRHTLRVSHGMAYFITILAATLARTTGRSDEDFIEYIEPTAFKKILNDAVDWYWNPRRQGTGLTLVPTERLSLAQLRLFSELLTLVRTALLAHELAHLVQDTGGRETELSQRTLAIISDDLDRDIARYGLAVEADQRAHWRDELMADILGATYLLSIPNAETGEPTTNNLRLMLRSIPHERRLLGLDTVFLLYDLLNHHPSAKHDHPLSHPPPQIRRTMFRTWFRLHDGARTYPNIFLANARAVRLVPDDWFEDGLLDLERNQNDSALRALDKAVEQHPRDWLAYLARARAHLALGHKPNGLRDFTRAIEIHETELAYSNRALVKLTTGDIDGAIADYGQALRLDSSSVAALAGRGEAHFARGDIEQAVADASAAINREPSNVVALRTRAQARLQQGDIEGVVADTTAWLMFEANSSRGLALRGTANATLALRTKDQSIARAAAVDLQAALAGRHDPEMEAFLRDALETMKRLQ